MQNKGFKVGIVGAGWIAEKAAITLSGLQGLRCYAIASRSQEKADAFAAQWGVEKAYGSYAALLNYHLFGHQSLSQEFRPFPFL